MGQVKRTVGVSKHVHLVLRKCVIAESLQKTKQNKSLLNLVAYEHEEPPMSVEVLCPNGNALVDHSSPEAYDM